MEEQRFTETHEWVHAENGIASIGITKYAADQLGDVVHVELPEPGRTLALGSEAAVVESVKAAGEIYAPVSGEVVESNGELQTDFGRINSEPEQVWFFRMRLSNPAELDRLMTRAQYEHYLKGL
jgi:glycine cleavage system H protein